MVWDIIRMILQVIVTLIGYQVHRQLSWFIQKVEIMTVTGDTGIILGHKVKRQPPWIMGGGVKRIVL